MDREGFRNRLKQYKLAREENPGLKYWEWKDIPKYDEGTDGVRDNTYVAPIEKELVFIPATGATKLKLDIRNKITRNGQIKSGAIDIVSPEFDLLTGIRSLPKLAFKSFDFKNKVNIGDKWNKWGSESLVQSVDDYYFKIPQKGFKGLNNDFAKEVRKKLRFNELPENTRVPYTYEGYIVDGKGHYFPVVKQKAVRQHTDESINNQLFADILNEFKKAGYSANTKYAGAQNKWYNVQDYSPNQNIGELNDKGVLFDAILGESYAPQFIKTFKENYEFIKDRPFITGLNTVSENTENFADGGEVGPDPLEVLERSKPKIAGVPINDAPLENAFSPLDIVLGTSYKFAPIINRFLPNYGSSLGALVLGSNDTGQHRKYQSFATKKLDDDVNEFYNDIVIPMNPNNEVYKQHFIKQFGNPTIEIHPTNTMSDNFAADFNPNTNKIRIREDYLNSSMNQQLEAHEYGHLLDKYLPYDKDAQQTLNNSLKVSKNPISKDSDTYRERLSTKREAEFKAFLNLKKAGKMKVKTSRAKTKRYQEYLANASDEEILELLGADTAYKQDYLAGNIDIDTLRLQMIYAPTIAAGLIVPEHLLKDDREEKQWT